MIVSAELDEIDTSISLTPPIKPLSAPIASSPSKPNEVTSRLWLNLPRFSFICVWLAIFSLHVLCGATLILIGRIYVFVNDPNMIYWAKLLGGADNPYFKISSVVFTIIGALHLQRGFMLLWYSIRERELVFRRKPKRSTNVSRMQSVRLRVASAITLNQGGIMAKIALQAEKLSLLVEKVIGRNGFLGIESKFFPVVFGIREIVEVASQTYQANRSCNLIPRPLINHIVMFLLITNCWSTPIMQHFLRGHPAVERVACLMMDALLNMGSNFVIPLTIFLPYYQIFDFAIYSFPYKVAYDTLWYARLVTENRMLFALSFPDLVSKLINHFSIYDSIVSVTTLIQRQSESDRAGQLAKVNSVKSFGGLNQAKQLQPSKRRGRRVDHRRKFAHTVFYIWGFILLVIYSRAVHRGSGFMLGCRDSMVPWFSTKYPCSVFTFNCYERNVDGPIGNELESLDNGTMAFLVYAHCPSIQVPAEIQNFPNMLGFQLHNCSIRSWSHEAAISAEKHPKLIAIIITRTNMTEFPEGLMGPLPATVNDVEFSVTNLTTLPSDLGQRWHSLSLLYFEYSALKEIPASVFQIPVIVLSFVGNQIKYLPALDDVHIIYYIVDLGYNPLQALPSTFSPYSYVKYLNVEGSNITSLSPWVYTNVYLPFGRGSPYCLNLTSTTPYLVGVGCMIPDPRGGGRVPIAVIDSKITL